MSFLPVVERELRVAARKRSTFWVRVIAALVAVVLGSGFLTLALVGSIGFGVAGLGKGLFGVLTWLSLAAALCAGLFLTSDALSEEKREGTLGFLFLTDLRGHDVVLAKLAATSLRGFYALLAIFPVLGITLVMGGVSGGQFWKTALALVNAMFLSLAAGLFVSAISRESQKAMAGTVLLLLFVCAGGTLGDVLIGEVTKGRFDPGLKLTSPVMLFATAGAWGASPYWWALLWNQIVAWTLLASACVLLPRTWQDAVRSSALTDSLAYRWKFGGAARRAALRRKLVDVNPVLWLACRERWQAAALWAVALLLAGGVAAMFATAGKSWAAFAWNFVGGIVALVLYVGIASQSCRFLVEGRRAGLLELLLASPLGARQIVAGQWRALVRMFALPLLLCLVAQFVAAYLAQRATWGQMASNMPPPPAPAAASAPTNSVAVTNGNTVTVRTGSGVTVTASTGGTAVAPFRLDKPGDWLILGMAANGVLTIAGNLVALVWFGMWMGLTSRNTNLATLKTILFVQVIPWFAIAFASAFAVPIFMLSSVFGGATMGPGMAVWIPVIMGGINLGLTLAKDAFFVIWSRRKLHSEFRARAAGVLMPVWRAAPPPPVPPPVPPSPSAA